MARVTTMAPMWWPLMDGVTIKSDRCAVCGRTDKDSPGMEFRYCSKCEGSYEYCMDHLYTHQHVKKSDSESK